MGNLGLRRPRRLRLVFVVPIILLLTACEPSLGTNYGWVQDHNGNHAACGTERTIDDGRVYGSGITWKEPTADAVCNYESRYQAGPGHLGNRVITRRNGVICADTGLSYTSFVSDWYWNGTSCADYATHDTYYSTVIHRWWSTTNQIYAQVTRNSPSIST